MGLDMYLEKRTYIGANYDYRNVTGTIDLKADGKPIKVNLKKVTSIIEDVCYWRKANAIHKWFVDNVQDGNDNCAEYYVGYSKLMELRDLCDSVISNDNEEISEELLPTSSGFFFGDTSYDEWYIDNLKATIKALTDLDENCEYYYSSSW